MLALLPHIHHHPNIAAGTSCNATFEPLEITSSDMKNFLTSVRYHTEHVPSNYITLPPQSSPRPELGLLDKEQILWVGCSDSNIIETDLLDVPRDELFVHRNLGNQLSNGDMSSLSAVQVCVDDMQVKHIIVCGHYGCELIHASGETTSVQSWLLHLKELRDLCSHFFPNENGVHKHSHLVELNVLVQMAWLMQQPSVIKAVAERGMEVHGFVFNPEKDECVRLVVDGLATGPAAEPGIAGHGPDLAVQYPGLHGLQIKKAPGTSRVPHYHRQEMMAGKILVIY
ncbi:hypothetical protein B7463_g780, partial [Scytalidium lignicola]